MADRNFIIRLDSVAKSYPEGEKLHRVLDGVDLGVGAGELVALLGPSGCGKSTLLNLMAGLDSPSGGRVEVAGEDLAALDETGRTRLRRDRIGFVFQFFNLVPTLTVLENLMLPLELAGRADEAGLERARALLERVGLLDRYDSFPDVLSGGQQQRVAIARALVHGPSLVLADEPTGNLDEASAEVVLELLESNVRDAGVTLVMATHSRHAASIADRVLRLHAGRIEEDGAASPAPELVASGARRG